VSVPGHCHPRYFRRIDLLSTGMCKGWRDGTESQGGTGLISASKRERATRAVSGFAFRNHGNRRQPSGWSAILGAGCPRPGHPGDTLASRRGGASTPHLIAKDLPRQGAHAGDSEKQTAHVNHLGAAVHPIGGHCAPDNHARLTGVRKRSAIPPAPRFSTLPRACHMPSSSSQHDRGAVHGQTGLPAPVFPVLHVSMEERPRTEGQCPESHGTA
jgi:hypothetical protein